MSNKRQKKKVLNQNFCKSVNGQLDLSENGHFFEIDTNSISDDLQIFNNLIDLNWAWLYEFNHGQWL